MNKEEVERLKLYCQNANAEDRITLLNAAISAAPGIEVPIYDSLVNKIGYDRLNRIRPIHIKRDDFYGYQRKTLDEYKRLLTLFGRWT